MASGIKIFPILLSTLSLASVPLNAADVYEEECQINEYIFIKNLFFYSSYEYEDNQDCSRIITFDIKLNRFGLIDNITANIPASLKNICSTPTVILDDTIRFRYQKVVLRLDDNFLDYIHDDTFFQVKYGNIELFGFNCPKKLILDEYFYINSPSEIPSNGLITRTIPLPYINNGRIEYSFTETLDISRLNIEKIINSYYGKFPNEYLWIKFSTTYYGNEERDLEQLKEIYPFSLGCSVGLFGYELFQDYYSLTDERWKKFPYESYYEAIDTSFEDYYRLDYMNRGSITLENGVMKVKANQTPDFLKVVPNKDSKYVTYPLDPEKYEKNYETARNMKFTIHVSSGLMASFHLMFTMNFDMKNDYFYNHLSEYSINGLFSNNDLDTVDVIYA
jgi:hypothetical protein